MNRDALLASLIGFGIGLLITGILLVGPNMIKGFPKIQFPTITLPKRNETAQTTPKTTPPPITFAITNPTADSIVTTADLVVSGTAVPSSMVVLGGPNDEDVTTAGADGKFSGKLTLSEGKNDITVTNFIQGKAAEQTMTVFYTKENW